MKNKGFGLVFRDGKHYSNRHISINIRTNELDHSRIGISVPKKAVKLAVGRNRIKRVIREWFRSKAPFAGKDIIIRVRHSFASLDSKEQVKVLDSVYDSQKVPNKQS